MVSQRFDSSAAAGEDFAPEKGSVMTIIWKEYIYQNASGKRNLVEVECEVRGKGDQEIIVPRVRSIRRDRKVQETIMIRFSQSKVEYLGSPKGLRQAASA